MNMSTFFKSRYGRFLCGMVAFTYTWAILSLSYPYAQTEPQPATMVQTATPGPEYRVGPGDHIYLSVAQRPDLNRELVIDEKGQVTLPLVGAVLVRGLTAVEIEGRLLQSLREYYPSIKAIKVDVTEAVSNVIYVSGDVRAPGKYAYKESMNVWEAIREAGGPTTGAALGQVRVIRDRARGGESFTADVQSAIENGSIEKLPLLKPGDTVLLPAREEVYTGSAGVNVFGAVEKPGVYPLQSRQDLMSTILIAGGPNDRAKLNDIRIIRPHGDGTAETIKINLDRFIEKGDMNNNPKILSGDTIHIGRKAVTSSEVGTVLGFITAIGTIVLLYYTIQQQSTK